MDTAGLHLHLFTELCKFYIHIYIYMYLVIEPSVTVMTVIEQSVTVMTVMMLTIN